ncbi:hypothetical protein GTP07_09585 [Lactococcus lactis]|uniref:hypothetical protein n=1 Tax=Lactococcus lactis TaxID=1358 RepID=UPI0013CB356B|nr:hypothetical protein [Lactococcus lactis]NEX53261.1 hypothetical protein [Lactococcus lactis]
MNKDYLMSPFYDKNLKSALAIIDKANRNNEQLLNVIQPSLLAIDKLIVPRINTSLQVGMEISESIFKMSSPAFEIMNAVQKNYTDFVFPLIKDIQNSNNITDEINSLFNSIEFNTNFSYEDIQNIRSNPSNSENIRLDESKDKHPDKETQEIVRDISTKMEEVLEYTRSNEIKHNIAPYANEVQFLKSIEGALFTYASGKILDKLWELDPIFSLVIISFIITFIHIRIKKMSSQ